MGPDLTKMLDSWPCDRTRDILDLGRQSQSINPARSFTGLFSSFVWVGRPVWGSDSKKSLILGLAASDLSPQGALWLLPSIR